MEIRIIHEGIYYKLNEFLTKKEIKKLFKSTIRKINKLRNIRRNRDIKKLEIKTEFIERIVIFIFNISFKITQINLMN